MMLARRPPGSARRRESPPPPEMRDVAPESLPCSCAMMRSTGPPGANCTITNEISMIPKIVGIIRSSAAGDIGEHGSSACRSARPDRA